MSKEIVEFEAVYSVIDRESGDVLEEIESIDVWAKNTHYAMGRASAKIRDNYQGRDIIIEIHDCFRIPMA